MDSFLMPMFGAFGTAPTVTGAGEQIVFARAFEAWEDTTISEFKDMVGKVVVIGWEDTLIKDGKTIIFPVNIKAFTIADGGLGQVYKYK